MRKSTTFLIVVALFLSGCSRTNENAESFKINPQPEAQYEFFKSSPLVDSARKQVGVVTQYDTSYYQGGYPPEDRGACTDVVERALRDNGYDLKAKIDEDMKTFPKRYLDGYDPNINYRRVRNVKIFLDFHAEKLST